MRGAKTTRAGLLCLLFLCSCRSLFAVREPLRIDNWDDVDERRLGLAKGATTLRDARQAMRNLGLTGVRTDTWVGEGPTPRMVSVLSADFQSRIHVFQDDRYQASVRVQSRGVLPFSYALRVARFGDRLLLVALYRDPLDLTEQSVRANGPRVDLFAEGHSGFEFVKSLPLDALAAENHGLTSPFFVGHDLNEGLMLLGRDKEGTLWRSAYLVTIERGDLALKALPMEQAARCSCVVRYAYGAAADEAGQD